MKSVNIVMARLNTNQDTKRMKKMLVFMLGSI